MGEILRFLAVGLVALAFPAFAADEDADPEKNRYDDTRRFYLYIDSGNAFQLHEKFSGDARLDSPDSVNYVLGGGGGYNFTRHWGFEIQGHGTEPDVRSRSRGKIVELSNITMIRPFASATRCSATASCPTSPQASAGR